jgi:hypothetical protein
MTSTAPSGTDNDISTHLSAPTAVKFHIPPLIRPSYGMGTSPDESISKMSDTASRLSAFENRFESVTQSLSSALKLLQDQSIQQSQAQKDQYMLVSQFVRFMTPTSGLPITPHHSTPTAASPIANATSEGSQLTVSPDTANQPSQEYTTGGPSTQDGVAGPS